MHTGTFEVYWAAPLFSASEQAFNAAGAEALRAQGLSVFLPQEHAVNISTASPSPNQVFVSDTVPLLSSQVLVAVIDGETIDSGVACEVGLAHQNSIPIVGVHTDFRQHRTGPGRMYKNLFVLGAIERNGSIVSGINEIGPRVKLLLDPEDRRIGGADISLMESIESLDAFITRLESWYDPPWGVHLEISDLLDPGRALRLLDFGCGVGRLARELVPRFPHLEYVGFDNDPETIAVARSIDEPRAAFYDDLDELRQNPGSAFDLVIMAFVLHDYPLEKAQELVRTAFDFVAGGGTLVVLDLTTWDLPRTTRILRRMLAAAHGPDWRLDAERVTHLSGAIGTIPQTPLLVTRTITFPERDSLLEYCTRFRVFGGADLPLGLSGLDEFEPPVPSETLHSLHFPMKDCRSFAVIKFHRED